MSGRKTKVAIKPSDRTESDRLMDPFDIDEYGDSQGVYSIEVPSKIVTNAPLGTSAPTGPIYLPADTPQDEESPLLPYCSSHSDNDNENVPTTYQTPIGQSPYADNRNRRSRSMLSFDLRSINDRVSQWTSTIARWTSTSRATDPIISEIQYSVFKPPPGIIPIKKTPVHGYVYTGPVNKLHFDAIVDDSIIAIEMGVRPKRIAAGSSGSYFIYNTDGDIVGVFKPKDEEPYGPLSPKWTKWIHRNLFPCFFGRSCLIPNLGYVCESAASLLDKQLQTYIVPYTDIVEISSDTFYYPLWERVSARWERKPLREKAGSYQLFLDGYQEADKFFQAHPLPGSKWIFPPFYHKDLSFDTQDSARKTANPFHDDNAIQGDPEFHWTKDTLLQFREELEKLVILDYIMRNTDRGLDNWMIGVQWVTREDGTKHPIVKVGAIDSGLSWPWKHPDEWRSYPFGWLFLPVSIIGQPFTEKTRRHFLPILTSTVWWEECTVLFRELFARDEDFKERMWKKQWAVMKGQAFNVVETLKNPTQGPLELARRTRVMVYDEVMEVPVHVPVSVMASAIDTPFSPLRNNSYKGSHSGTPLDAIMEGHEVETAPDSAQTRSSAVTGENENEVEEDGLTFAQDTMATKKVIIERLQAVNSKPPMFTCC